MTDEQIKKIKESFNLLDKNGDGRISVSELAKAQQALGMNPSRKEVAKMIKEIDRDDSGFIELREYVELMKERVGALDYELEQMKAAFRHFDKDRSGKLSRDELRRFLTANCGGEPLTQAEFDDVMADMDVDGDGQVDVDEVCKTLCKSIRR